MQVQQLYAVITARIIEGLEQGCETVATGVERRRPTRATAQRLNRQGVSWLECSLAMVCQRAMRFLRPRLADLSSDPGACEAGGGARCHGG